MEEQIYTRFLKDSIHTVLSYKEELYGIEMKFLDMNDDSCDKKLFNEYVSRRDELTMKTNHLVSVRESVIINNLFNSNWKTYRLVKKYCFEDALDLKNFLIGMMQSKGFVYKSNVMDDIREYYFNSDENIIYSKRNKERIKKLMLNK